MVHISNTQQQTAESTISRGLGEIAPDHCQGGVNKSGLEEKNLVTKIRSGLSQKTEYVEGQLSVDIFQSDTHLIILAPIAGCSGQDVELTVTDDVLSIKGRREMDPDIDTENYFTKECFWGTFSRAIVLPTKTDTTKISARFEKGILRIEIPKVESKRTRKIEVVEIL